jgi:hypothetical protein
MSPNKHFSQVQSKAIDAGTDTAPPAAAPPAASPSPTPVAPPAPAPPANNNGGANNGITRDIVAKLAPELGSQPNNNPNSMFHLIFLGLIAEA